MPATLTQNDHINSLTVQRFKALNTYFTFQTNIVQIHGIFNMDIAIINY